MKNQFAADTFRRLDSRFLLMIQILLADSNRGWQSFNEDPKRIAAVTAEDIQRVAKKYFKPEIRAVALFYTRKAEGGGEDPLLTGLSDQDKAQVRQFKAALPRCPSARRRRFCKRWNPRRPPPLPNKEKPAGRHSKLLQERIQKTEGK